MIIMIFIGLNMLTMTLDHYHQSPMWSFALDNLNMGFIVIFSAECILKIFALRQYYFKEQWNVFDFVVVILSILGKVVSLLPNPRFVVYKRHVTRTFLRAKGVSGLAIRDYC